jgi:hypothetical protein
VIPRMKFGDRNRLSQPTWDRNPSRRRERLRLHGLIGFKSVFGHRDRHALAFRCAPPSAIVPRPLREKIAVAPACVLAVASVCGWLQQ